MDKRRERISVPAERKSPDSRGFQPVAQNEQLSHYSDRAVHSVHSFLLSLLCDRHVCALFVVRINSRIFNRIFHSNSCYFVTLQHLVYSVDFVEIIECFE